MTRLYTLSLRLPSGHELALLKHATGEECRETTELLAESEGTFVLHEELRVNLERITR